MGLESVSRVIQEIAVPEKASAGRQTCTVVPDVRVPTDSVVLLPRVGLVSV